MTDHYYLIISAEGRSEIKAKETPEEAARYAYPFDYKAWHVSKGRADHHFLAYEFEFNGSITGRMCHIVDLGPTTAYEEPGLPTEHKMGGLGERYVPEEVKDLLTVPGDPCARCSISVDYEELSKHHHSYHHGGCSLSHDYGSFLINPGA